MKRSMEIDSSFLLDKECKFVSSRTHPDLDVYWTDGDGLKHILLLNSVELKQILNGQSMLVYEAHSTVLKNDYPDIDKVWL